MKSEIQSLPERKLRRLSRAYSIIFFLFLGAGLALLIQGAMLAQPILQYIGAGAVILSKSPFDNHRYLRVLLSQRLQSQRL